MDDTLVRRTGQKRIPNPAVVEHVRALHAEGAQSSAEELGIAERFRAFLPKPNVVIDAQELMTWRRLEWVRPRNCTRRRE